SQGAGLMSAQYNSMVQRLHAGKAAHSGVISALLAKQGFSGIKNILEADYGGFANTYSDKYDLSKTLDGLGKVFESEKVGIRLHSSAGSVCTSIDAILELVREHQLTFKDIKKV